MATVTQVPPEALMEVACGVTTVVAVTGAGLAPLSLLAAQPDASTTATQWRDQPGRGPAVVASRADRS